VTPRSLPGPATAFTLSSQDPASTDLFSTSTLALTWVQGDGGGVPNLK
jgi:hypothetical protein